MKIKSILSAAIFVFLAGCSDEPPPKTIGELSSAIKHVEQSADGKKIIIEIQQNSLFGGGVDTERILEGLLKNFSSLHFEVVEIVMNAQLVDKYGAVSVQPLVSLQYPRTELEKIKFENVTVWQILNLAVPQRLGPYARRILAQDCEEEKMAKYAHSFCRAVDL